MRIPNNWQPRPYQRPLWDYLEKGGKRAIGIWHRRAGKDDVMLHRAAVAMLERPATYWHCLPQFAQARKAIWNAVNPHTGIKRIDEAFPKEIRTKTNDHEMYIELINGATWQVIGSDRYNNLVGAGVAGVTFSEWALCNPSAWGYISPMMRENNGWAAFITTPRGKNHAYNMMQHAIKSPDWFGELLSIENTKAMSAADLEDVKAEYISLYGEDFGSAQFEQEYLCSFDAAILGAYYGGEIARARSEGRICSVEWDESIKVYTVWDIGYSDDTCILFCQFVAGEVRIIDTHSSNGKDPEFYANVIKSKPYDYAAHWLPHDAQAKTLVAAGRSLLEQFEKDHGLKNLHILPNKNTEQQGIMAARSLFPRLWIDIEQEEFISAISQFRREWDDDKKCFREHPVHDWTNHFADTLRYLAWVWQEPRPKDEAKKNPVIQIGGSKTTMTFNDLMAASRKRRLQE